MPHTLSTSQQSYLRIKRLLELFLVIPAILVLLPFFALLCLAIVLDSKGNPIFVQERPGLHGKLYRMYKFRSMYLNTLSSPFKLTDDNDPRVTRIGQVLRKYHLDELPQLYNVLKGEMSLVGPRPLPAALYHEYRSTIPNYDARHLVKPGMTGFAQVWLGYTNTIHGEAIRWHYDMVYIRRVSLSLDTYLLFQTLFLSMQTRDKLFPNTLNQVLHWQDPKMFALSPSDAALIPSSFKNILRAS